MIGKTNEMALRSRMELIYPKEFFKYMTLTSNDNLIVSLKNIGLSGDDELLFSTIHFGMQLIIIMTIY
jgi:hypothetical protein